MQKLRISNRPRSTAFGVVFLAFSLLSGCGILTKDRAAKSLSSHEYPNDFMIPSSARSGYGMARRYHISHNESYREAMAMGIRHLSWTYPLRVKGVRLHEHGPSGSIDFSGQDAELVDGALVDSAACVFDSVTSDRLVW